MCNVTERCEAPWECEVREKKTTPKVITCTFILIMVISCVLFYPFVFGVLTSVNIVHQCRTFGNSKLKSNAFLEVVVTIFLSRWIQFEYVKHKDDLME